MKTSTNITTIVDNSSIPVNRRKIFWRNAVDMLMASAAGASVAGSLLAVAVYADDLGRRQATLDQFAATLASYCWLPGMKFKVSSASPVSGEGKILSITNTVVFHDRTARTVGEKPEPTKIVPELPKTQWQVVIDRKVIDSAGYPLFSENKFQQTITGATPPEAIWDMASYVVAYRNNRNPRAELTTVTERRSAKVEITFPASNFWSGANEVVSASITTSKPGIWKQPTRIQTIIGNGTVLTEAVGCGD